MQKFIANLKLRSSVRADGTAMVQMITRIDSVRKDYPTYIYVPPRNWDVKKKEVKAGKGFKRTEAAEINLRLAQLRERAEAIAREAIDAGEYLDHDEFLLRLKNRASEFELNQFYQEFIDENPGNLTAATLRLHKNTLDKLEHIHPNGIRRSQLALLPEKLDKYMSNMGLGANTRKKNLKHLKTILRRAEHVGHKDAAQCMSNYRIGTIRGHRQFLEIEEMERLYKAIQSGDLPKHLDTALKAFLFTCFTGMRVSDLREIGAKNIVNQQLQYMPKKTQAFNKVLSVPLPQGALKLINPEASRFFRLPTDQQLNRNIRLGMHLLGVKKHLSIHCGRHTYATLYLHLGGTVHELQQLLGHSKIATTMEYVHMAELMKIQKKSIFDEHFEKLIQT